MKLALSVRLLRLASYVFVLVCLPAGMVAGWLSIEIIAPFVSPAYFIAGTQIFLAVLIVVILVDKNKHHVPTVRERDLNASREQFLSLFENSPIPYVTIDATDRIVMYNLAAVRLLKTTTEALLGQSLTERFVLEDMNELSVILGKIDSGYTVKDAEAEVKTMEEGDTRWILLSVFVYEAAEQRLVAMVDITHQKTVDQAKSEFVALATHQLRTPVAAVRWNLELLARTLGATKTDEQAKYLMKLERNVLRMIALINDFLSVSKLEAGTFATTLSPINLVEFFDSIVDEFTQTIVEKNLQLERDYEPRGLMYQSDSRLLHIMVSNLLSNAVKYVRKEGTVTIRYERTDTKLIVVVSDNGIGIPQDEQEHLFSKFFRARNAQSFRAEGTGLGLYIVKESAEKLGGTVEVVSSENVGTIFTVKLPYQV